MGRRRKGQAVHGWVILDKPEELGSTKAVSQVRRVFDAQKAGHAGTLDPLACGVLPIALGEATKTVPYIMSDEKTYQFTVKWGEATSTDDREGEVTAWSDVRPDEAAMKAVLDHFVGEIDQVPPAFSAIKVAGKRSYDMARRGDSVDLPPRRVQVKALHLLEVVDSDRATFEVTCGKGTYVRALARDIAASLGTVGHVVWLCRTRVGPFKLEDAISLDKLTEVSYTGASFEHLLPVVTALDDISALAVTGGGAQRLRQGRPISLTRGQADVLRGMTTVYAIMGSTLIAIGDIKAGQFHPTRVFNLPLKEIKSDVDYC